MNDWKVWLKSLLAAFIQSAATSFTVTIVDPIAFNFGDQWAKTAAVAFVSGIIGAALYLKDSPLPGIKKTVTSLLLIGLLGVAVGAPSCKTTKVSEITKAAKAFAIAPVAMRAAGDIAEILEQSDELDESRAQAIYHTTEDAQTVLDQIQADIEAKRFDQKRTAILLKNLNTTVNATIQSGVVGIKNPQTKQQIREWSALFSFTIDQILATLDAIKPPVEPGTPTLTVQSGKTQTAQEYEQQVWSAEVWSRVVAVSTRAAIEWGVIRREADAAALWQIAKSKSQLLHEANKERLK